MLANFIAELSDMSKDSITEPLWILKTAGSSKPVGEREGMVLQSLKGLSITQEVKFSF